MPIRITQSDPSWMHSVRQCPDCSEVGGVLYIDPTSECWKRIQREHLFLTPNRSPGGPGTELKKLIAILGIEPKSGCKCLTRAKIMDRWGVDGCRRNRPILVQWLEEAFNDTSLGEKLTALRKSFTSGLIVQMDLSDPLGWLVDYAIQKA